MGLPKADRVSSVRSKPHTVSIVYWLSMAPPNGASISQMHWRLEVVQAVIWVFVKNSEARHFLPLLRDVTNCELGYDKLGFNTLIRRLRKIQIFEVFCTSVNFTITASCPVGELVCVMLANCPVTEIFVGDNTKFMRYYRSTSGEITILINYSKL